MTLDTAFKERMKSSGIGNKQLSELSGVPYDGEWSEDELDEIEKFKEYVKSKRENE